MIQDFKATVAFAALIPQEYPENASKDAHAINTPRTSLNYIELYLNLFLKMNK